MFMNTYTSWRYPGKQRVTQRGDLALQLKYHLQLKKKVVWGGQLWGRYQENQGK